MSTDIAGTESCDSLLTNVSALCKVLWILIPLTTKIIIVFQEKGCIFPAVFYCQKA